MSLKILFISHNFSPFVGGIEFISEVLAENFTKKGHEVHLLTWTRFNEKARKTFPYKVIRDPGLIALFKEHNWADVVFENNPALRLSWPAIFFKKPSFISIQTWISRIDGRVSFKDKLKLKWLRRASKVIACSKAIQERCFHDSVVIPNPYKEKSFHLDPNIRRDREFVFLGRMVSDKGADLAIKAFSKIVKNGSTSSNLRLTMIGDGPERKSLEVMVKNLNLEENVKFTGCLQGADLVNCLNKHKCLLVPSVWEEPFGIVVLEGMACGCIPIVSDGGGLPDAMGDSGLIFKRGNVDQLALCMQQVLDNPEKAEIFQDKVNEHLENFKSSVVTKMYLDIIERTVKAKQLNNLKKVSA